MAMFPGAMMANTHSNLQVDDDIPVSVSEAADNKIRAIKVAVDAKGQRLTCVDKINETDSLEDDFVKIKAACEDGHPCMLLIQRSRDRYSDEAGDPAIPVVEWTMLAWTPEDSPVKQKMLGAASRRQLCAKLSNIKVKEWQCTDRDDVSAAELVRINTPQTDAERRAAMSREEQEREDIEKVCAQEQNVAPRVLPGIAALSVHVLDSFKANIAKFHDDSKGKALLLTLEGDKHEDLGAKIADDVPAISNLKGVLPKDQALYALVGGDDGFLLISWLPDDAPRKFRMSLSTFKTSVVHHIKEAMAGKEVFTKEVDDADFLTDDLLEAAKRHEQNAAGYHAAGSAAAEELGLPAKPAPGTAGYKPPGAVALPGMGGMMAGLGAKLPKRVD